MAKGKFIAYYRVSTATQGKSGLGLAAQREAVSAYIRITNSEVVGEFEMLSKDVHNYVQHWPVRNKMLLC